MNTTNDKLHIVYGDVNLGVHGSDFEYLFNYQAGGPVSFQHAGMEWLYRAPKPTFWRATTDNDRGNGFNIHASQWYAADQFIKVVGIEVAVNGQVQTLPIGPINNQYSGYEQINELTVTYTYQTTTLPTTKVTVAYTVTSNGTLKVAVHYFGQADLPSLPVFGLRFVMPTVATGYKYQGLSGETYPDRYLGGINGTYTVEGLPVTPYLVPQDCGMHIDTEWVEVIRNTNLAERGQEQMTNKMRVSAGMSKFGFACIPYTAQELENATHQEELPVPHRTVLTILGAIRGVGGIDSWGSDVQPAYHIDSSQHIRYDFKIDFPK